MPTNPAEKPIFHHQLLVLLKRLNSSLDIASANKQHIFNDAFQIHSLPCRYDSCNQKAKIVKEIYTCLVAPQPID